MARLFHTASHHYQEQGKGTLYWRDGVLPVKKTWQRELSNIVYYLGWVFFPCELFLFIYSLTLVLLLLPFGFVSHCCFK